jgi:hypothetical protein
MGCFVGYEFIHGGQVSELKVDMADLLSLVNFRPNRNITIYGGYTMALRRNIGHVGAAAALSMVTGDDVHGDLRSKKIVYRYEHRVAIGMAVLSGILHSTVEAEFEATKLAIVRVGGDDVPLASKAASAPKLATTQRVNTMSSNCK